MTAAPGSVLLVDDDALCVGLDDDGAGAVDT